MSILQKMSKATRFFGFTWNKEEEDTIQENTNTAWNEQKTVLRIGLHGKSIFNIVVCQKTLFDLLRYDMSQSSADFNLFYSSLHFLQLLENLAMKNISIP